MDTAKKWETAARRYELHAQKQKLEPKIVLPVEASLSFQQWLDSEEGKAARLLLHNANREIVVGYTDPVNGQTAAAVFAATSRIRHVGVVGLAAAYTKEEPERTYLTNEEFVRLSFSVNDDLNTEADLIQFLRTELNQIADESP